MQFTSSNVFPHGKVDVKVKVKVTSQHSMEGIEEGEDVKLHSLLT
jgi:hypothetical protein